MAIKFDRTVLRGIKDTAVAASIAAELNRLEDENKRLRYENDKLRYTLQFCTLDSSKALPDMTTLVQVGESK